MTRTSPFRLTVSALTVLTLGGCAGASAPTPRGGEALITRGQYLVTVMDCGGCHTPGALVGQPDTSRRLAGSTIGFGFPGGVVYPPNLTPDPESGLGRWSDAEIVRAVRGGQRKDGRALVPIMPWPSYAVLTEADVAAIVAYLRSLPPVPNRIPGPVPAGVTPPASYLGVIEPR